MSKFDEFFKDMKKGDLFIMKKGVCEYENYIGVCKFDSISVHDSIFFRWENRYSYIVKRWIEKGDVIVKPISKAMRVLYGKGE